MRHVNPSLDTLQLSARRGSGRPSVPTTTRPSSEMSRAAWRIPTSALVPDVSPYPTRRAAGSSAPALTPSRPHPAAATIRRRAIAARAPPAATSGLLLTVHMFEYYFFGLSGSSTSNGHPVSGLALNE